MDILFEDKDDAEKRDIFEKFLTYRRRMSRLCAVQAVYMYDIDQKVNNTDLDTRDLFSSTTSEDLKTQVLNICHSVLYFYKTVFFCGEEYSNNQKKNRVDEKYFQEVALHTIQNIDHADKLIHNHLNERWTLDQLDLVIKAILRCAVAEILYNTKTDIPILTSEYTNLTSQFFNGKEIGFVNGIIDKISKLIRYSCDCGGTANCKDIKNCKHPSRCQTPDNCKHPHTCKNPRDCLNPKRCKHPVSNS